MHESKPNATLFLKLFPTSYEAIVLHGIQSLMMILITGDTVCFLTTAR